MTPLPTLKRPAPDDAGLDSEHARAKRGRIAESAVERSRRHYNKLRVVLEKTIQGRYRNGGSNYDHVGVLLVCWEHDDLHSLGHEIHHLEQVFRDRFKFNVEIFRIPSEKTITSLNRKVSEFAHQYDSPSDLAILYYGGHGGAGADNRLKLYATNHPYKEDNPSAFFEEAVYALHHCDTDVLIITDCCYAALAFTEKEVGKRKFELLTATGPGQRAHAPQSPQSFTRHLRETLEELVDSEDGFTTSKLYRKLYFKANPEFKPFLFDQSVQDWGRICLKPLAESVPPGDLMEVDGPTASTSQNGDTVLHMELRLRSKPKPHNMNELARAMQYLPYVKQIKFKKMYAPKLELQGFMSGVLQAIKIRPFVTRLRKRIEAKRESEGRVVVTQPSPGSGISSPSPHHFSHIYNWNESKIEEVEETRDGSTTPQPANTVMPLDADLLISDQKDEILHLSNDFKVTNGEAADTPQDEMHDG